MTRENKLALVVGFALIVFVGVLVSDHFSAARLDKPANLAQRDGRFSSRNFADGELIDLDKQNVAAKKSNPVVRPAVNTAKYKQQGVLGYAQPKHNPVKVANTNVFRLPDLQDDSSTIPAAPKKKLPRKISSKIRTVIVKPNESLSAICQREYREGSLAGALAEYNGITDPNMVRAGMKLRLPDRTFFGIISKQRNPSTKAKFSHYTVKSGDTLSDISQKLLNTARRWQELFELNRDVIDDPGNVRAGITLKIPKI